MKIFILLLLPLYGFATVHYAKIEPVESSMLKSAVSASVVSVDLDAEGTMVQGKRVVYLDDALDKINLASSKKTLTFLHEMLDINKDIAKSLQSTVERQKGYYNRINKLSTASKTQKDTAFSTFSTAKTQYLSTKEKIVNLEKQILDVHYKISQLEDTIIKKSLVLKDKYLYKLMVREGDFVAPGTVLAQVMDMSSAKLILFLEESEMQNIQQKTVYLNDEKTNYKVTKVWQVADEKFISSYRAEIVIDAPKGAFSELIKVEIK
ncbi:MAG TPA: hypothetical protein EYP02_09085 [Sulfurovum sp.]|nr:hypothetical protein [Sulfurovum sp.]